MDLNEFEKIINDNDKVMIDFYATWCNPCKMMMPVVEELKSEATDAMIVKANIDTDREITEKYAIMSVPTFVLIKGGREVNRMSGATSKENLKNFLSQ